LNDSQRKAYWAKHKESFTKPTATKPHEFDPKQHGTHVRNIMYPEQDDECSSCGKSVKEHRDAGQFSKAKTRKPYLLKNYNFDTGHYYT